MKTAIMQPYFFPYIGYFSLIKNVDVFILIDEVQYIRHGWIERNRILKPIQGWNYIKAPLYKQPRDTIIRDMIVNNEILWKDKILAQLQHYKRKAPYFYEVLKFIHEIFSDDYESIVELNHSILEKICNRLDIHTPIKILSSMNLTLEPVAAPDEWALNICKAMGGVKEYWNPPGGVDFFNPLKYSQNNIELKFQKVRINKYNQKRSDFEGYLSIIDVMMFNSTDTIKAFLDDYDIL